MVLVNIDDDSGLDGDQKARVRREPLAHLSRAIIQSRHHVSRYFLENSLFNARFGMTPELGVATILSQMLYCWPPVCCVYSLRPSLKQYTSVLAKHHSHMMVDIMS